MKIVLNWDMAKFKKIYVSCRWVRKTSMDGSICTHNNIVYANHDALITSESRLFECRVDLFVHFVSLLSNQCAKCRVWLVQNLIWINN